MSRAPVFRAALAAHSVTVNQERALSAQTVTAQRKQQSKSRQTTLFWLRLNKQIIYRQKTVPAMSLQVMTLQVMKILPNGEKVVPAMTLQVMTLQVMKIFPQINHYSQSF